MFIKFLPWVTYIIGLPALSSDFSLVSNLQIAMAIVVEVHNVNYSYISLKCITFICG